MRVYKSNRIDSGKLDAYQQVKLLQKSAMEI